jgi:hypothetical protein
MDVGQHRRYSLLVVRCQPQTTPIVGDHFSYPPPPRSVMFSDNRHLPKDDDTVRASNLSIVHDPPILLVGPSSSLLE